MTAERLDPAEVEASRHARDEVLGRIEAAAARAGLDADLVTLVAVSKTVPADRIRAAIAAGDLASARALLGRRVAVTGSAVDRSGDGRRASLAFPLPVALPPAGTYAGTVAVAWGPGIRPGAARRAKVLVADRGAVEVTANPDALRHDRLRVTFAGR